VNPKISIIVPVYNAEHYLVPCIQSLRQQTLKECEFIFVNDGSSDSSRKIIEEFVSVDPRMILINQDNQGVSMARNAGLTAASGEYIGFVDADDYIEQDMYKRLYNTAAASQCDVVVSNLESEIEGRMVISRYPFRVNHVMDRHEIRKEVLPIFLKSDHLNTAVNKLYKRLVISTYDLRFPDKVPLGEDAMFNISYFSYAASMIYLDYTGYHYREVPGSATRNLLEKDYFHQALQVFRMEPPTVYKQILSLQTIHQLKSIRLIASTMSYIYTYFKPGNGIGLRERYKYVKQMITSSAVREALPIFCKEQYDTLGRYDKLLVRLMKARLTLGLLGATSYSRLRNR